MIDSWQVKKNHNNHMQLVNWTTDKAPEDDTLILQNQALICGLFKKDQHMGLCYINKILDTEFIHE